MAEARQVKNRIVQAVLRECQKLKEKDDLTDELEHVRDIKIAEVKEEEVPEKI